MSVRKGSRVKIRATGETGIVKLFYRQTPDDPPRVCVAIDADTPLERTMRWLAAAEVERV